MFFALSDEIIIALVIVWASNFRVANMSDAGLGWDATVVFSGNSGRYRAMIVGCSMNVRCSRLLFSPSPAVCCFL